MTAQLAKNIIRKLDAANANIATSLVELTDAVMLMSKSAHGLDQENHRNLAATIAVLNELRVQLARGGIETTIASEYALELYNKAIAT